MLSNFFCHQGNLNGRDVVIKRYTTSSAQSARQYIPDFQRLHQHENIVEILGYCIDTSVETMSDRGTCRSAQMSDTILVVEEYMPNGCVFDFLRASKFSLKHSLEINNILNTSNFYFVSNEYFPFIQKLESLVT
jgi:serine/threonine protein kinase